MPDFAQPLSRLIEELKKMGIAISYLAIHEQSLEDVFIHYTGKTIREAEAQKVNIFAGAGVPQRLPPGVRL